MQMLRALIGRHRHLALLLVALGFCIKAAIPAGFMVSASSDTVLTISICSDTTGTLKQMQLAIPAKQGQAGQHSDADAKTGHCAFAGLGHVAISGADVSLLIAAIAFILMIGFAPVRRLPARQIAHLLPPQCGPPVTA